MAVTDYATQMGLMGTDVDRAVQMNGQPAASTHRDEGSKLGTAWMAAIAASVPPPPPPPPPPTFKTQMGSAKGGWPSTAAMVAALGIGAGNIIRAFNPADSAGAPAACSVLYSNDGGDQRGHNLIGATIGSPGYLQWYGELQHLRDDCVHYVDADHEWDINGDSVATVEQIFAGLRLVTGQLNKTRTHPIRTVSITTGMPYDTSAYLKSSPPSSEFVGVDNYNRKHWSTIDAYAKSLGKGWIIGETGYAAGAVQAIGDTSLDAALAADHALWDGKATAVCYWPNWTQDLATGHDPATEGLLKSYIAAGRV